MAFIEKSLTGYYWNASLGNKSVANDVMFEEAKGQRFSQSGYTVTGIILSVISVLGIFNHLSVVLVILKNRQLRTPVNLLLLNLSASDLVIAAFGTPLTAGAAFAGTWIYGKGLCTTEGFAMALTGIASITTLAVISAERYMLIAHAGAVVITIRKTAVTISAVWMYALVVTFPPLVGWSSIVLESHGISCAQKWESSSPIDLSYGIYLFFFGLVLPLGLILWCYANILIFIRNQAKSGVGQGVAKSQKKLTQMVFAMVVAFLIAWLPYACVSVIVMAGRGSSLSPTAKAAPAIFAKSSLVYNPIIYALFNPQLRNAFLTMITCGRIQASSAGRQADHRSKVLPSGLSGLRTGAASAYPSYLTSRPLTSQT